MKQTNDEFYVGYLPMPAGHRRFVIAIACGLLLTAGALAALVASEQRDPGPAVWDLERATQFEGVIETEPYALLRMGEMRLVLVLEGKRGALGRVSGYRGQRVRLSGHVLMRGPQRLLELSDQAVEVLDATPTAPPASSTPARRTLAGEIIDPKCYTGAMKPGSGKTHKACASLCLRGGIPPMFAARDDKGNDTYYLLVDSGGAGLTGRTLDEVLPYVGDAVDVDGWEHRRGETRLLHLEQIRRRHGATP